MISSLRINVKKKKKQNTKTAARPTFICLESFAKKEQL